MREFYRSEDNSFHLYAMEGELWVAFQVPNHTTDTVVIPDEDLVDTIEYMMAYAEERGLIHRKWKAKVLKEEA